MSIKYSKFQPLSSIDQKTSIPAAYSSDAVDGFHAAVLLINGSDRRIATSGESSEELPSPKKATKVT